jgi:hypothetical protein
MKIPPPAAQIAPQAPPRRLELRDLLQAAAQRPLSPARVEPEPAAPPQTDTRPLRPGAFLDIRV